MQQYFTWKTILITGGTGFLGYALTKEILKQNPHSIRIYSRDEVKHFKMQRDFGNNPIIRHLIWDIRDKDRLLKAMNGVDYVIHAAALKRLDILEYNTEESVKTNIIGTLNLVAAANEAWVKKVVFISTDKSCSPINTYGGCKFVSERIITESNYSNGANGTIFLSVRYGNVVNSTGSIVPILQEKIRNNQDFQLTDERMTRFLITEEDAIRLIFDAFEFGIGWEVIVPKLDSCKVTVLMDAIKRVNNYTCEIKNIWLRPGEKIHEYMINEIEWSRVVFYKNRYIIQSLIQEYKYDINLPIYLQNGERVVMWDYSSENSLIDVNEVIHKFGEYLKVK